MALTLQPGALPLGVNLGEDGAVVTNYGAGTVSYSDTETPFVAEGTIAALAAVALSGTQFFQASTGSVVEIHPIEAVTGDGSQMVPAPSGASVDTATLNTSLELARAAGGGTVEMYPGATYNTSAPIVIGTGVKLRMNGATIKPATAANCNAVETYQFATYTGSNLSTGTPNSFEISGGIIDGNKANQGAGNWRGLAIYGYGYKLDNMTIRSCKGVGLWMEWSNATAAIAPDSMEAMVTRLVVHACDGVVGLAVGGVVNGGTTGTLSASGIAHMGPHDTHFHNGRVYQNGTTTGNGSAQIHTPLIDNSNGSTFDDLHIWGSGGMDYCLNLGDAGCTVGPTFQAEGAAVAQVYISGPGSCRLYGKLFGGSPTFWGASKGLLFGTGVSNVSGKLKIENCGGGVFDWGTTPGGATDLEITGSHTSVAAAATAIIGSPNIQTNRLQYHVTDGSGGSTLYKTAGELAQGFVTGGRRTQAFSPIFGRMWKPTAALRDNFPRMLAGTAEATLTSGTLFVFVGPYLFAGDTVTNIVMKSGTTAGAALTNQWFALLDQSLNVLAKTVDDTSTAWGSFALKTLTITGNYVPAADVQTYFAVLVAAGTTPSLRGASLGSSLANLAPVLMGTSTTGLTTPASLSGTPIALTQAGSSAPYGYVTGSTTLPA